MRRLADDLLALGPVGHVREEQPGGARVEDPLDVPVPVIGDPDDRGDAERPRHQDHVVQVGQAQQGVLGVQDDEVETGQLDDLDGLDGGDLHEGPDRRDRRPGELISVLKPCHDAAPAVGW